MLCSLAVLQSTPAVSQARVTVCPNLISVGSRFARVVGGRIDIGAVESQPNPLPGDYNFNGVVDAADGTVWRDTLNSVTDLRADGNGDSKVDALDYAIWKNNFGLVLTTPESIASFHGIR